MDNNIETTNSEYNRILNKNWGLYNFIKRAFDICSSFLVILIISPFLLLVTLLVAITSSGSPIYSDKRIGKNGKEIHVYKFRTMFKDANTNPEKYLSEEQMKQWIEERKVDNDPRITKIGKILRKTSIDEFPQLFNILFGSLSVVGYRPITKDELEAHFTKQEQEVMLLGKPGLTGYWQVYGRGKAEYHTGERQKLELEYYSKRSLMFDFKLIFLTIPAVLKGSGAK